MNCSPSSPSKTPWDRILACRFTGTSKGFTLIEVVVGLVIMASILVASLMAHHRHQRQLATANAKQTAVAITDELLQQWLVRRSGIPITGSGPILGKPTWFWQTRLVGVAAPAGIEVRIVRCQILERTATGSLRRHCSVDVVKE